MTPREVLIAARALIEKPENWTKRMNARDDRGRFVDPRSDEAASFCAIGSVHRVTGCEKMDSALDLLYEASPYRWGVGAFNDAPETTHADVLNLFDRALEKCNE